MSVLVKKIIPADTADYYKILSEDYPDWLDEYINTKKLQDQKNVSVTCGKTFTKLFDIDSSFSSLDHSIAVALIIWHFTHDKKQTLSGLFHDIATPAFKHCVDFMNGDYLTQESTEGLTTDFIKKSKDVIALLERDGIKIEEIDDYHIYPIADNNTPRLAADRLEYTFSNAFYIYKLITLPEIKEFYDDLEIGQSEYGDPELAFKTKAIARKFVKLTSKMSVIYRDDKTRYSMQFIADVLRRMKNDGDITIKDLYTTKETDIIERIKHSKYNKALETWQNAKRVSVSETKPSGVYYVKQAVKIRYIDPLYKISPNQYARTSSLCKIAKNAIEKNLSYNMGTYVYLDFSLD